MWFVVVHRKSGDRRIYCESKDEATKRMRESMLATVVMASDKQLKKAWHRAFYTPMRLPTNWEEHLDAGRLDSYLTRLAERLTTIRWSINKLMVPYSSEAEDTEVW